MTDPPKGLAVLLTMSYYEFITDWKEGPNKSATSRLYPGSTYLITEFTGPTVTLKRMN
jgi:hypothetical protein